MSDLSATNCGCGCEGERYGRNNGCGLMNNSCIWIILLLFCCGGCGNGMGMGKGNDSCIWIILLLCCCGGFGGSSYDDGGCGCGC